MKTANKKSEFMNMNMVRRFLILAVLLLPFGAARALIPPGRRLQGRHSNTPPQTPDLCENFSPSPLRGSGKVLFLNSESYVSPLVVEPIPDRLIDIG